MSHEKHVNLYKRLVRELDALDGIQALLTGAITTTRELADEQAAAMGVLNARRGTDHDVRLSRARQLHTELARLLDGSIGPDHGAWTVVRQLGECLCPAVQGELAGGGRGGGDAAGGVFVSRCG